VIRTPFATGNTTGFKEEEPMPQKPTLGTDDESTRAEVAKRKAALAQTTDDSPAPGVAAASPRDAGKNAWDFGHDFDGGSHRGGAELESIKEEFITDLHASWPYDLDFGPAQNASKVPERLRAQGLRDFELYAYLTLIGFELSPAEREKAFGEVNLPRFVKRPEIIKALAVIGANPPVLNEFGAALPTTPAVQEAVRAIGEAYASIKAGASSAAMAPDHDAKLWKDYYSHGSFENVFVENLRQREAKAGSHGSAGGFTEGSTPQGDAGGGRK